MRQMRVVGCALVWFLPGTVLFLSKTVQTKLLSVSPPDGPPGN